MKVETSEQKKEDDRTLIKMRHKKEGEIIHLLNCVKPANGTIIWTDSDKGLDVEVNVTNKRHKNGNKMVEIKRSYMNVKWILPPSSKPVKHIRIAGLWKVFDVQLGDRIYEVYPVNNVKSNSNRLENAHKVLNSEISDEVKISGQTDAINVTGAEPGEQIKVYTVSGVEVKSVVANDDVVNIKLPTNQIYIVKAGQARHKVAL